MSTPPPIIAGHGKCRGTTDLFNWMASLRGYEKVQSSLAVPYAWNCDALSAPERRQAFAECVHDAGPAAVGPTSAGEWGDGERGR